MMATFNEKCIGSRYQVTVGSHYVNFEGPQENVELHDMCKNFGGWGWDDGGDAEDGVRGVRVWGGGVA